MTFIIEPGPCPTHRTLPPPLKGSDNHWRYRLRHVIPYATAHRNAFIVGFLLLALTNASAATIPYLMKLTTEALTSSDHWVAPFAMGLILLALVNAIVRIRARTHIFGIGRSVEFALRQRYHAHLLELDAPFFDNEKTGDLVARGNNDITSIRMFIGPGFLQVSNTIMVYAITLPVMIGLDSSLTLLVLSPFPLVLGSTRILTKRLYRLSRKVADSFGHLSGFVQESITGIAVIRTHARENDWCNQFSTQAHNLYDANIAHAKLQSLFSPLTMLSGGIGAILLLMFGGNKVAQGDMTIGDFVAFSGYLAILIWPTVGLGWILTVMQRGLASLERVGRILDAQPSMTPAVTHPQETNNPRLIRGGVSIDKLDFSFANGPPVLSGITLDIPPGSFVGLIGRVGSGKSTLLSTLARLYPIPPKRVWIDGLDLTTMAEEDLRALIAMAPQESFLFAASVRENLDPGNRQIADETMWQALKTVALDTEVSDFSLKLDTLLGERGITLSGGQRQRLALARLLLADPAILLLDDVFSNVDARTEEKILMNLKTLAGSRTIIMVCHRVAALHNADCIHLMEAGKILASGSHPQLIDSSPLYQNLHSMMARKEALSSLATAEDSLLSPKIPLP